MTDPWDIVNAPIHYIPAPRRRLSARMFAALCIAAIIFGSLWAFNH